MSDSATYVIGLKYIFIDMLVVFISDSSKNDLYESLDKQHVYTIEWVCMIKDRNVTW